LIEYNVYENAAVRGSRRRQPSGRVVRSFGWLSRARFAFPPFELSVVPTRASLQQHKMIINGHAEAAGAKIFTINTVVTQMTFCNRRKKNLICQSV
jgi:hypothetical protein